VAQHLKLDPLKKKLELIHAQIATHSILANKDMSKLTDVSTDSTVNTDLNKKITGLPVLFYNYEEKILHYHSNLLSKR
jgi:hypothetical protein